MEGHHIYGGLFVNHFGHFLLDTLSRAWYVRGRAEPVVWQARASGQDPRLLPWQREIFEMLGIRLGGFVTRPTEYERLTIPDAGAATWTPFAPEQIAALGVFPFQSPGDKRIWLSRARWGKAAVENEGRLQSLLLADGWTILHPQELSVRDQLGCMADARLIAGFDGSAFHTLLLAREIRARVVVVRRSALHGLVDTFRHIADAKGFTQEWLDADLIPVRGTGRGAVHRLADPAEVARALG